MPNPGALAWTLLLAISLIWGGSFMAVEYALQGFAPLTIAAARIALAAVGLVAYAVLAGPGLPSASTATGRRIWLHAAGMGMMSNAVPFTLLSWGQQNVSSGFAGITMAGVPLLVLPLAHVFVPGERLTARRALGFAVGFAGVVTLIGPGSLTDATDPNTLARLACIASAGCYACGSIITRRAPAGPMLSFSAAALLIAALTLVPVALAAEGMPPAAPPLPALVAVVYLGFFPTALATLILVHIIKTAGPSFLSLSNYLVPVWAVVFGVALLGEAIPPQALTALALILTGLVIAQTRAHRSRP